MENNVVKLNDSRAPKGIRTLMAAHPLPHMPWSGCTDTFRTEAEYRAERAAAKSR